MEWEPYVNQSQKEYSIHESINNKTKRINKSKVLI